MNIDHLHRVKEIKENVVKQYQAAINQLKLKSYSMHISARRLTSEYAKTLSQLDAEFSEFKSRDGKYILLMDDTFLRLKLEQSLNKIANKFLAQIWPITSGRLDLQILEEEEIIYRDSELRAIMDAVSSGAAVADFSGDVLSAIESLKPELK